MTTRTASPAGNTPAEPGPSATPDIAHRSWWWTEHAAYFAAAWAGLYGVLALIWTLTGDGYPFGPNDDDGNTSLLRLLPADVAAPTFAGVLLVTAVAALAMAGNHAVRLRGVPRYVLLTFGWLTSAVLLVVVPDIEVLAVAGYAPMLIIGAPFGWPPVDYADVFSWALLNKAVAIAGGLLIARTVLTWHRRTAGLCAVCGRGAAGATWTSAASAARWGRWAAYTAAVIPVLYASTRFAWLAGIPLGISDELLRELHDSGGVWAGAGLATFGVVGGVLTLGLVQRWGEVFPRWMPGLAGRRVPIELAVVPGTLVALAVAAASTGLLVAPGFADELGKFNAATGPMLLWPLWAVALGAATLAYHLRRRGECARCRRS